MSSLLTSQLLFIKTEATERTDNYKTEYTFWYRCQFCHRGFRKREDFIDHKVLDHLEQFLQSQSPTLQRKTETNGILQLKQGKKTQDDSDTHSEEEIQNAKEAKVEPAVKNEPENKTTVKAVTPYSSREQQSATLKRVRSNKGGRTRFQCRFCHKILMCKINCMDHEDLHLRRCIYKCKFCSKKFTWNSKHRSHEQNCSFQVGSKKTPVGSLAIKKLSLRHISKMNKINRNQTGAQPKKNLPITNSESASEVSENEQVTSVSKKYLSSKQLPFSSVEEQKSTMKKFTDDEGKTGFKCRFCHRVFNTRTYCTDHENKHLGLRNYRCRFCQMTFIWQGDDRRHEKHCKFRPSDSKTSSSKVNPSTAKELLMKIKKPGVSKSSRAQETVSVKVKTKSLVNRLALQLSTRVNLKKIKNQSVNFIDAEHNKDGKLIYLCKICKKVSGCKKDAVKHYLTHIGLRPYKCSQCPRSFACRASLVGHESIHRGIKRYQCKFCGLKFTWSSGRLRHEKRCRKETNK